MRKEDSARGSGVSIGIIGVGGDGRDGEGVFLFRDVPERTEDALFRHDRSLCGSISQGEADLCCRNVGSVAWSEIAGTRCSGRLSSDDGYFFSCERRRSTKYEERASRCVES
jgi:hypothetical protein